MSHRMSYSIACEQAFGRAGNWEEEKVKRPVDKHLGPLFHSTRCASDPDASSYWLENLTVDRSDHWLFGRHIARDLITMWQ